jgi:hypothetical protein
MTSEKFIVGTLRAYAFAYYHLWKCTFYPQLKQAFAPAKKSRFKMIPPVNEPAPGSDFYVECHPCGAIHSW